ncbi:MAG TPA: hypothetical protein VKR53_12880, partial [Puia sp.]|nr:hypothetical protein [Puia sp.]
RWTGTNGRLTGLILLQVEKTASTQKSEQAAQKQTRAIFFWRKEYFSVATLSPAAAFLATRCILFFILLIIVKDFTGFIIFSLLLSVGEKKILRDNYFSSLFNS